MTKTFQVIGMTCSSCEAKVQESLLALEDVNSVEVSKDTKTAKINMKKEINLAQLQEALDAKYWISALKNNIKEKEESRTWFETYKPILLIFFYISMVTFLIQFVNEKFNPMEAMRHFMAGFFLVFSFFKILNIKGFAESYAMYDLVAKKIPIWGYVYAFLEMALGIAFVIDFQPYFTNWFTLILMSVSIFGVLESVLNKKKIQCACLGAVFDLPMSTITIIEDALMIAMSAYMLIQI